MYLKITMSVAFSSTRPRGKGEVTQQTIQKMLDENHHLIQCIMDYQSKGKTAECTQYQQILHRNLVYLATIADSNQNMQTLLPAPPNPNMNMGPGGMGQSGGGQSLHSQANLNENMASGLPPTSMMQSGMSNGPSHAPMQQQQQPSQTPLPSSTSMSLPASGHHSLASGYSHPVPSSQAMQHQGQGYVSSASRSNLNMQSNQVSMMHQQSGGPHYSSAQGGSQHYQGQQSIGMLGQGNQGNSMMAQRPMGSYRSSQQGSAPQYTGQDEFYGEQYGHGQSSSEPINQQYYPDGNHAENHSLHMHRTFKHTYMHAHTCTYSAFSHQSYPLLMFIIYSPRTIVTFNFFFYQLSCL
ncbi:calcium-responsive transactivator-like isoform X5 [Alosa sapidissima]|uniref:calcium-responsive transactivator-like isoform X5 n=1 Tax=Alosa sapidissima TaxID=34773 RepID=UPI001C0886E0|nr:calcium-responsive transactivator-like isoform X5 [Alosa sapidissima]